MVHDQVECLWRLISYLVHLFNVIQKALYSLLSNRNSNISNLVNSDEEKLVETMQVNIGKSSRKRPAMIVIPNSDPCVISSFLCDLEKEKEKEKDTQIEGNGYFLFGKKGKRHANMEDGYKVITNINGDCKQALFGVFDGHGGCAAVDFVSNNLGNNIIKAVDELRGENKLEDAIRLGYLNTDKEFLSMGSKGGACASTVLVKKGELHVANLGDCRIVLCKNQKAYTLTSDHNPRREDEKARIENLGGYVSFRNGTWRVQDTLAVSRAIGDANLKEWIISEPEISQIELCIDCEFLIIASDGLWNKVSDQEAVDTVLRHKNMAKSCKDLADMSCRRGSNDDITVMLVDLHSFL